MGKGSDGESADFAKEMKWFLWNEVWYAANSCRAWSYSGDRHKKMLERAQDDAKRSKEHLAAVEKKQVCSDRTLKHMKVLARAVGNEISRAVLTNGRLAHEFATAHSLQEENDHMRSEVGPRGWEGFLQTLTALSEHAVSSLLGDKAAAAKHKDNFDVRCESLRSIYLNSCEPTPSDPDPSRLGASRAGMPRQVDIEKLDEREVRIFNETGRAFRPKRTPEGAGRGRVSVVTPTTERRQNFHRNLWGCFLAQDWPDRELVIVETYQTKPSEFLTELATKEPHRLCYVSFQRPADSDWCIGLKRNIGASLATGEWIASFDDDDLYAPEYLSKMVECMKKSSALGVTLSSWYVFDTATNSIGYANPRIEANMRWMDDDVTEENVRKWIYGYGFSYVYRRQVALEVPYDSIDLGEDYQFFSELLRRHGDECIALLEDKCGIALHTQHRANTAKDYALWKVPPENVSDLDFSDFYPVYEQYQKLCLRSQRAAGPESVYEFSFARSAPRRNRDVKVHLGDETLKVSCFAGATCAELLEAMEEQHGRGIPATARVSRLPHARQFSAAENERWLQKVVRIISPVAPPVRQILAQTGQNEDMYRELMSRVRSPIRPQDGVGIRTTDLWIAFGSEH